MRPKQPDVASFFEKDKRRRRLERIIPALGAVVAFGFTFSLVTTAAHAILRHLIHSRRQATRYGVLLGLTPLALSVVGALVWKLGRRFRLISGVLWGLAVVVVVASLNLVLDFDFIEEGAEQGAPKYMEWYAGFGLVVTLVWLYLELLRLLSKLRD